MVLSNCFSVFQHTAARRRLVKQDGFSKWTNPVSTHSRPKAAAIRLSCYMASGLFQHTAARRRLLQDSHGGLAISKSFQHTAARRRLLTGGVEI